MTESKLSEIYDIFRISDEIHPCEILADMYALSKIRKDYINDKYLHCGAARNIGLAWKEASDVMGFELSQCCGKGYEIISRCLERLDIRVFKVL